MAIGCGVFLRFQREIKRLRCRATQQRKCFVHGFEQLRALGRVPLLEVRAGLEQATIILIPRLEPHRAHAGRRAHGFDGVGRIINGERPVLSAETAASLEGLDLFAFAIGRLADVDESWERRMIAPASMGDPSAEVRRGDGERWLVAGVPVVLMA